MKHPSIALISVAALACGNIQAALVGYWNFDSYTAGPNPTGTGLPQPGGDAGEGYFDDLSGNDQKAYGADFSGLKQVPFQAGAGRFGGAFYSENVGNNGALAVIKHTDAINFNQESFTISFWEKSQYRDVAGSGWAAGRGRSQFFTKAPYLPNDPDNVILDGYGLNLTQNNFAFLTNKDGDNYGQEPLGAKYTFPTVQPLNVGSGSVGLTLGIASSGTDLTFTWNSKAGKVYDLLSATDLTTAPATWTPWQSDIAATPETNVETFARPGDAVRFFVLVEKDAPPFFEENFDGSDGGFTIAIPNMGSGTEWAWGMPNSPDQGGGAVTADHGGSGSCWGTNLTGGYVADTVASLRSPVIDLTGATGASLSFALSLDAGEGHRYEVNVIEEATDTVIANVIPATGDGAATSSPWGIISDIAIPAAAIGQKVRLEWRFTGNGDGTYNGAYIDDVVVTGN